MFCATVDFVANSFKQRVIGSIYRCQTFSLGRFDLPDHVWVAIEKMKSAHRINDDGCVVIERFGTPGREERLFAKARAIEPENPILLNGFHYWYLSLSLSPSTATYSFRYTH